MQQYLTIILTTVIAITTIIYTIFSFQLWKTSRQSAEMARQTALGNLWSELNHYVEIAKQEGRLEEDFLHEFSILLAEYMIASLMSSANTKTDPNIIKFKHKVETMIEKRQLDISTMDWLAPFLSVS